ncbi:MAG: YkgJ family cysteine cluster protein [Methanocella sp.]
MRSEVFLIRKVTAANVQRLARRKEPENWAFREWLRESGIDAAEIDVVVNELYRQESAAFDCTTCASCCKGISPLLDAEDIARLAVGLGMPADRVVSEYLVRNDEYGGWSFNRAPCPLMENNRCSCYEHRPHDCASYPHLQKDRFVGRLSNTVANCSVCPIVYMVYERLKAEIETQRARRTR